MDPFDSYGGDSGGEDDDDFAYNPEAKEAAEQALMTEGLGDSPLPDTNEQSSDLQSYSGQDSRQQELSQQPMPAIYGTQGMVHTYGMQGMRQGYLAGMDPSMRRMSAPAAPQHSLFGAQQAVAMPQAATSAYSQQMVPNAMAGHIAGQQLENRAMQQQILVQHQTQHAIANQELQRRMSYPETQRRVQFSDSQHRLQPVQEQEQSQREYMAEALMDLDSRGAPEMASEPSQDPEGSSLDNGPAVQQIDEAINEEDESMALSPGDIDRAADGEEEGSSGEVRVTSETTDALTTNGAAPVIVDAATSRNSDNQAEPRTLEPALSTGLAPMDVEKPLQAGKASSPQDGPKHIDSINAAQRPIIKSIVVGSPKKVGTKNIDGPATHVDEEDKKKDVKRKKPSRPVRKVLVAKKERDLANSFLRDKRDLLDILPMEDCRFLAEKFWVFTVQQLRCVLQSKESSISKEHSDGDNMKEQKQSSSLSFAELLTEVACSPPVRIEPIGDKSGADQSLKQSGEETEDAGKPPESSNVTKKGHDPSLPGKPESGEYIDGQESPSDTKQSPAAKLQSWQTALEKAEGVPWTSIEKRFPLDGPISFLFPKTLQNFLASVPIKTLYGYLSLKRTETGAICDLLRVWRRECGLSEMAPLALAKHLLGIGSRLEKAISSIPPVDPRTRKWMNDPIVVLTGAAREFLFEDQGILFASQFVETRTKDLASALVDWRERKGMVPLKGSGKVAMISGWKGNAKEAMEAEANEGKVLEGVDLEAIAAKEVPIVKNEVKPDTIPSKAPTRTKSDAKSTTTSKKRPPTAGKQAEYALRSKLFLEDVLGEAVAGILSSAGVKSASELFEVSVEPDSLISRAILEAKRVEKAEECETVVREWCQRLRDQLDRFRRVDSAEQPSQKKPKIKSERAGEAPTRRMSLKAISDPYEALSAVTQRFLGSMGITTGEEFLSTRTTDIANEFVQWRMKEGMPELKGLGAIASVSGWKASCRKVAKEMGMDDVAELEPKNKSSWASQSKGAAKDAPAVRYVPSRQPKVSSVLTHDDLLFGKPRRMFAVQGGAGDNAQYRFELTLRKTDDNPDVGLFITYKGVGPRWMDGEDSRESSRVFIEDPLSDSIVPSLPVLLDSPLSRTDMAIGLDLRATFETKARGLIELAKYGLRPLRNQDLHLLKEVVKSFVLSGGGEELTSEPESEHFNVLLRQDCPGRYQYLLYLAKPFQRGQTVELQLPTVSALLRSGKYRDSPHRTRQLIDEALHLLSRKDLQSMLNFLFLKVLGSTGYKSTLTLLQSGMQGNDSVERFVAACEARQRLHWVSRRILAAMGEQSVQREDGNTKDVLYFRRSTLLEDSAIKTLPEERLWALKNGIFTEMKKDVLAMVEVDPLCGSLGRTKMCRAVRQLFEALFSDILAHYALQNVTDIAETLKGRFQSFLEADITVDDCILQPNTSKRNQGKSEVIVPEWDLGVVACKDSYEESALTNTCDSVTFRHPVEVREGKAFLDVGFYREQQWEVAETIVSAFGSLVDSAEFPSEKILSSLEEIAEKYVSSIKLPSFNAGSDFIARLPSPPSEAEKEIYQPHSFQFFLGIVWPTLRTLEWRLDAGQTPAEISFVPPTSKGRQNKRVRLLKQQRDRKRARLIKDVNQVGLGTLPKFTKRLFLATSPYADEIDDISESDHQDVTWSTSVEDALSRFMRQLESRLNEDDSGGRDRAKAIVDSIRDCFDSLAPSLCSPDDDDSYVQAKAQLEAGKAPREAFGCDVLMRFLLILPSVIRQSDLPMRQVNDTLEVIRELTAFISSNYEELLSENFHPPPEVYEHEQKIPPSTIAWKLRHLQSSESGAVVDHNPKKAPLELKELVYDEDKGSMTDYTYKVMKQAIPCRATEDDVGKRNRKIDVGFPGLVCRHCQGAAEGRCFYSSVESLMTAPSGLEKHLVKCPAVPPEIRSEIAACKSRHSEQRKTLATGSQQAYFVRLWERLRSSSINDVVGVYMVTNDSRKEMEVEEPDVMEGMEFRDYIELLDYIRTTEPWKDIKQLQEALTQYYNCIDYGGRIYGTDSMPKHFSAEWLLAKVVPRRASFKKPNMPG